MTQELVFSPGRGSEDSFTCTRRVALANLGDPKWGESREELGVKGAKKHAALRG
jgi:hypothetical protein